jgi:hypothetical protein
MTNEDRKTAILDLWHDIATDRSLQVSLRLKASEYEAKALGLIGDQPGITVINEPDQVTEQLKQLTIAQLEAIAGASDAEIMNAKKTTAQNRARAQSKQKIDTTSIPEAETPKNAQKSPNTANKKQEGKK